MWITNSPIADVMVVWAKDDGGTIRGFLLEKGMKGCRRRRFTARWGCAPSITGEIVMDDVFVPDDNLLPGNDGEIRRAEGPVHVPQRGALRHCLGRHGRRRVLLARGAPIPLDRKQFDRPLAANQLIQKKLADMQTEIALGLRARCASAGSRTKAGTPR